MAKEVNNNLWKLVSISVLDGVTVSVYGIGLGSGSLVMTITKGTDTQTSTVVYVPDLRLKEVIEKDEKGVIKNRYWAFNMGNIG